MQQRQPIFPRVVMSLLIFGCAVVLSSDVLASSQRRQRQPRAKSTLVRVEAKYVCMINNQHFPKEQIPINVDGRTYYGCCDMCKAKLQNDPGSRTAVDPVSGTKVDKATAIIGASSDGKVLYFESVKNLTEFKGTGSASPQSK